MNGQSELSYADSCFPLKLLYGHSAALDKVDYILYPECYPVRERDGEEDQKYSCPLIQASPFIVRQALDLGERLLIPMIDFSQGDAAAIKSFTGVGVKMGFSPGASRKAARRVSKPSTNSRPKANAGQPAIEKYS